MTNKPDKGKGKEVEGPSGPPPAQTNVTNANGDDPAQEHTAQEHPTQGVTTAMENLALETPAQETSAQVTPAQASPAQATSAAAMFTAFDATPAPTEGTLQPWQIAALEQARTPLPDSRPPTASGSSTQASRALILDWQRDTDLS